MYLEDLFCGLAATPPHRKRSVVVPLCYHRLSDHLDGTPPDRFTVTLGMFDRHVSIIRDSGLEVIGPDRFFDTGVPALMIIFDDNSRSPVEVAMPALAERGMTDVPRF